MAIREKNKVIEFSYENDKVSSGEATGQMDYDIEYNPAIPDTPLTITDTSKPAYKISCPVDLLIEIIDFLTQRGIIQKPVSNVISSVKPYHGATIPITTITRMSNENPFPISSFDVSNDEIPPESETANESPRIDDGSIKIYGDIPLKEGDVKAMKERPVIKTKVRDPEEDPQAAEKESSTIRKGMKKNKVGLRRLE